MNYINGYRMFESVCNHLHDFFDIVQEFLEENSIVKIPDTVYESVHTEEQLSDFLENCYDRMWSFTSSDWSGIVRDISDNRISSISLYNLNYELVGRLNMFIDNESYRIYKLCNFTIYSKLIKVDDDKFDVVLYLINSDLLNTLGSSFTKLSDSNKEKVVKLVSEIYNIIKSN